MHPVGLAFYAAISDICKKNDINPTGKINPKIRSIPYLQRMGLFSTFGFIDPVTTETHEESGRFIPLTKVRTNEDLNKFIKSIDPLLHTTIDNSRVIKHVFSEVLRNVLEHSSSSQGGNVCATYNRRRKKISIGISDIGIGLMTSLAKYHNIKNEIDAIRKAVTPGISGTTSKIGGTSENAGAGLFFTKCIAKATRNHFLIYSGSSYYKLGIEEKARDIHFNADPSEDKCYERTNLPYFPGTLVGIDINIEDNEAFNHLMENIGNAYTLNVKKAQKDYYKRIKFT